MRNLCKILSVILMMAVVLGSSALADNTQYADILHDLDLFKGTDLGYELDKPFTREQAATMLVRLSGAEEAALSAEYEPRFDDVRQSRWSFNYVMYCYENEITKGASQFLFEPERNISAAEFLTLVMRMLGYTDAEPETIRMPVIHKGLLGSEQADTMLSGDIFLRDDMVFSAYRCLKTQNADGELFADVLARKGVITKDEAEQFDAYRDGADIDDIIESLIG